MFGRIVPARCLEFLFEPIDIRGIDWPVLQHDIGSEHKRMLEPPAKGTVSPVFCAPLEGVFHVQSVAF